MLTWFILRSVLRGKNPLGELFASICTTSIPDLLNSLMVSCFVCGSGTEFPTHGCNTMQGQKSGLS
jgi:hypothetical protein